MPAKNGHRFCLMRVSGNSARHVGFLPNNAVRLLSVICLIAACLFSPLPIRTRLPRCACVAMQPLRFLLVSVVHRSADILAGSSSHNLSYYFFSTLRAPVSCDNPPTPSVWLAGIPSEPMACLARHSKRKDDDQRLVHPCET